MQPDVGTLVMFCGQKRHKGDVITSGVRYILVGQLGFQSFYACDTLYNLEHRKPDTNSNAQPVPEPKPKSPQSVPVPPAKYIELQRNATIKPRTVYEEVSISRASEDKDDDDDQEEEQVLLRSNRSS